MAAPGGGHLHREIFKGMIMQMSKLYANNSSSAALWGHKKVYSNQLKSTYFFGVFSAIFDLKSQFLE